MLEGKVFQEGKSISYEANKRRGDPIKVLLEHFHIHRIRKKLLKFS